MISQHPKNNPITESEACFGRLAANCSPTHLTAGYSRQSQKAETHIITSCSRNLKSRKTSRLIIIREAELILTQGAKPDLYESEYRRGAYPKNQNRFRYYN